MGNVSNLWQVPCDRKSKKSWDPQATEMLGAQALVNTKVHTLYTHTHTNIQRHM